VAGGNFLAKSSALIMPSIMARCLLLLVLVVPLLSGCGIQWHELTSNAPVAPAQAAVGLKTVDATVSNPPYPGEYKMVTKGAGKDLEELWQARGELGKFGGTFTCATFGTGPKTFNYWDHTDSDSSGIGMLMYESLIDIDPWTGKVYPRLAREIKAGAAGKEYTIVLRKGLKWSDGYPITADDVIFTYNTIIKGGYGNTSLRDVMTVNDKFPEVTKIDDMTVRFRTEQTFAPLLSRLGIPIAPKHIMEAITKKPVDDFHRFWDVNCDPRTIVTSGCFKMDRYVPGQRVEFVRNPYYAMVDKKGQRLPYLDRFVVVIVPDQNTMLLKFYGNELDILDIRAIRGSDAALIKQREKTGNFKLYNLGPDDGTMFFVFNMARRKDPKTGKFYVPKPQQDWFNNDYFRQAMTHAVDRTRIVRNVLRGVGYELFTCESPAAVYFDKSLKPFPQDMQLAAELLKKGGFQKKGDRLYDANNNRVEFTLNTNAGNTNRDAICVMIQNDLKNLGIKVNYQPIDFNILIDKVDNSLDWHSVVMGLTGSKLEPYDGFNVWKSGGRLHIFDQRLADKSGKTVVTDARPWEKEIDECLENSTKTLDDATRRKFFDRYQQIAYDEQPFIYLYSALILTAIKDWVGNYMPTPLGVGSPPRGSLHNLEEIYMKQERH
jgi:peptide/nickel transport system substrate-binding protein